MWVGLGIMKTVAAPILVFYNVQNHNTNANKEKKQTFTRIFSRRIDVGRTGYHEDCDRPNVDLLQSTETIIPTPIK